MRAGLRLHPEVEEDRQKGLVKLGLHTPENTEPATRKITPDAPWSYPFIGSDLFGVHAKMKRNVIVYAAVDRIEGSAADPIEAVFSRARDLASTLEAFVASWRADPSGARSW
jgi:hypothetical protein